MNPAKHSLYWNIWQGDDLHPLAKTKTHPFSECVLLAPGLGFEPRYTAPEAVVLPLDDPGMWPYNRFFCRSRQCLLLTRDIRGSTLSVYENIKTNRHKRARGCRRNRRLCCGHCNLFILFGNILWGCAKKASPRGNRHASFTCHLGCDYRIRRLWKTCDVVFGWKEKRSHVSPFFNDWVPRSYHAPRYRRPGFLKTHFLTQNIRQSKTPPCKGGVVFLARLLV